jgi:hypothetical protein
MFARLTLPLALLATCLAACATASPRGPLAADQSVGRRIDEVVARNGPVSRRWDLPDGRRAYQWQETSVIARVGGAEADGEVTGAASQTTCYLTLYAQRRGDGGWTVIGYDAPPPGCQSLAMNGRGS